MIIRINIIHYLKIMLMNELLKMKFFELLSKTSQEVTNTEMQDAYGEFVKHIVAISNSEDYSYIFRMLKLHLKQHLFTGRGKNALKILYVHKALSTIDAEL